MTEHQLQKLICNLLSYAGIYFFETDVMDGLKFCGSEKQRLAFINHHKAMGYKPGQSDLVIILPKRIVFVEIKMVSWVVNLKSKKSSKESWKPTLWSINYGEMLRIVRHLFVV